MKVRVTLTNNAKLYNLLVGKQPYLAKTTKERKKDDKAAANLHKAVPLLYCNKVEFVLKH